MSQFLEPERGAVLQREGSSRRYFYRFADPIFQPYVILTGLSRGLITDDQLRKLQKRDEGELSTPTAYETSSPQQLF